MKGGGGFALSLMKGARLPAARLMKIRYIGHSCFAVETNAGNRLVIDPYDPSIGLTPVNETADVLLITHDHPDHAYADGVHGDYERIDAPGTYEVHGMKIRGLQVPHDSVQGADRGYVTAYLIEADGLRLLHLGDVGAMPDEEFMSGLGRIDVLMIPVGGTFTVDAQGALAISERIAPNLIIPMHFKTNRLKMNIAPAAAFVERAKYDYDIQRQGDVLMLNGDTKKKRGRIILMENSF